MTQGPVSPYGALAIGDYNLRMARQRAEQAVAQAQAAAPAPVSEEPVPFIFSDGSFKHVSPAEARFAMSSNAGRPATPEEAARFGAELGVQRRIEEGGLLGQVAAASAGALQNLPLVGPPAARYGYEALERLAGTPEQEAEARARALMGGIERTTGGKVGGFLGPLLPTIAAGAGVFGKGAAEVASSFAPKAMAAQGAVEGAAFGATESMKRSFINNEPVHVENMVMEALEGGALGGMLGLGFGMGVKGARAVKGLLSPKVAPPGPIAAGTPGVLTAAEEQAFEVANKAREKYARQAATAKGHEYVPAGPLEGIIEPKRDLTRGRDLPFGEQAAKFHAANKGVGDLEGDILQLSYKAGDANATKRAVMNDVDSHVQKSANQLKNAAELQFRVTDDIFEQGLTANRDKAFATLLGKQAATQPQQLAVQRGLSEVEKAYYQIKNLAGAYDSSALRQLEGIAGNAVEGLKGDLAKLTKSQLASDAATLVDTSRKYLQDIASATARAAKSDQQAALSGVFEDLRNVLVRQQEGLRGLQRDANVWGERTSNFIKDVFGPASDMIETKSRLGRVLGEFGTALDDPFEKGLSINQDALRKALQGADHSTQQAILTDVKRFLSLRSTTAARMEHALGLAPRQELMAVDTVLDSLFGQADEVFRLNNLVQKAYIGRNAMSSESVARMAGAAIGGGLGGPGGLIGGYAVGAIGGTIANPTKALQYMTFAENSAAARSALAAKAAAAVVKTGRVAGPPPSVVNAKNFHSMAQNIYNAVSSPERVAAATRAIFGEALNLTPTMATALMAKTQAALGEMAKAFPPPPANMNPLQGHLGKPPPPSAQTLQAANTRLAAVVDPLGVYKNPTKIGMEVLKSLYPDLHKRMQGYLADELAASSKVLNYNDQLRLSLMFGMPTNPLNDPRNYLKIQQHFSGANRTMPAQGGGGGGGAPLHFAKETMTMTQQLESPE